MQDQAVNIALQCGMQRRTPAPPIKTDCSAARLDPAGQLGLVAGGLERLAAGVVAGDCDVSAGGHVMSRHSGMLSHSVALLCLNYKNYEKRTRLHS